MNVRTLRLVKGILIGICFIGLGLATLIMPSTLTQYGKVFGVTDNFWALYFIISGIMNMYIGVTNKILNAIWLAPIFCFSVASVWASTNYGFNYFATFVYVLVSGLLFIDWFEDVRGQTWKEV